MAKAYKAAKKSFLFVSSKEVRFKLGESVAEAHRLGLKVGANGWVTVPIGSLPATSVAKRWIAESYRLVTGRAADKPEPKARSAKNRKR